jgi:hypothetical protein
MVTQRGRVTRHRHRDLAAARPRGHLAPVPLPPAALHQLPTPESCSCPPPTVHVPNGVPCGFQCCTPGVGGHCLYGPTNRKQCRHEGTPPPWVHGAGRRRRKAARASMPRSQTLGCQATLPRAQPARPGLVDFEHGKLQTLRLEGPGSSPLGPRAEPTSEGPATADHILRPSSPNRTGCRLHQCTTKRRGRYSTCNLHPRQTSGSVCGTRYQRGRSGAGTYPVRAAVGMKAAPA